MSMQVDVVSKVGALFSGEAEAVFVPTLTGEIGIYPMHSALLSILSPGEVRVLAKGEKEHFIYISGGLIEVQPDCVTIFSDSAERSSSIDESQVLEARRIAEQELEKSSEEVGIARAKAALAESLAQLQIIQKRKNR